MTEQKRIPDTDSLRTQYISSEVRFYTVKDMMKLSGWSENAVLRLFSDPEFPASNYGRAQIVEAHALIDYFSTRRTKERQESRRKGDLRDELRKRVR